MAPPVEYGGGGDGARVGSPGAGFEQACAIIADDKAAASAAKAAMDRLDGKKYGGYVEVTLLGAKGVPYDKSMFSMLTKAPRGEVRLLYKNQEVGMFEIDPACDKTSGGKITFDCCKAPRRGLRCRSGSRPRTRSSSRSSATPRSATTRRRRRSRSTTSRTVNPNSGARSSATRSPRAS